MEDNKNSFGNNLRTLRSLRGMGGNDLAKLLGVTASAVSSWELGKREPGIETLKEIAKIFNVSMDTLLNHQPLDINEEVTLQIARELYERTRNNPVFMTEVLAYADYLTYKKDIKKEK